MVSLVGLYAYEAVQFMICKWIKVPSHTCTVGCYHRSFNNIACCC